MYASVYRGILNILINKTSRSILIDRLKKSLFCRDHQSIRKIKIEIFQTIERHKMVQNVELARITFQKLDLQRVSSASMIISKQKARNR